MTDSSARHDPGHASATPRSRFVEYVRSGGRSEPVVSPFLPHADVVVDALRACGLEHTPDPVDNEIRLSAELGYEPMFMTQMAELIFPWQPDTARCTPELEVSTIPTQAGTWVRRTPRWAVGTWDESCYGVRTPGDYDMLVRVCEQVGAREAVIRAYFEEYRRKVGEAGVIVIGHPHPGWLCSQIGPQQIYLEWNDHGELFRRAMDAIAEAALFVMAIALEEGVDFMSDSSYGLEMTSPELFDAMDLPYIVRMAEWTHDRGGLFWYHNCGDTAKLILEGRFDSMGADVIETLAEPPEGDNDLETSRRRLGRSICSKGNLNLTVLRRGKPQEVEAATRRIVRCVRGFPHIVSTADAVLPGTPGENLIAFVQAARRELRA